MKYFTESFNKSCGDNFSIGIAILDENYNGGERIFSTEHWATYVNIDPETVSESDSEKLAYLGWIAGELPKGTSFLFQREDRRCFIFNSKRQEK